MADLTTPETEDRDPREIWLEPACQDGSGEGRCWCAGPLDDCDDETCGLPAVRYVRADLHEAALSAARREAEEARAERDRAQRIVALARTMRETEIAWDLWAANPTGEGAEPDIYGAREVFRAALRADSTRGESPDADA